MHHRHMERLQERDQEVILPEGCGLYGNKKIKHLKHTGSISDYVNEFSSLMFEDPSMDEKDLLLNLIHNL